MTNKHSITEMSANQDMAQVPFNEMLAILCGLSPLKFLSRTTAAPPGSPANGDCYVVAASGSGLWSGKDGKIAIWYGSLWFFISPQDGYKAHVVDEVVSIRYNGSAWVNWDTHSVTTGLTASTTHTQGQVPLTSEFNVITVCANLDDTVTMPPAEKGKYCAIRNNGAFRILIFPAAGDAVNGAAVDASFNIATLAANRYVAVDGTNWYSC